MDDKPSPFKYACSSSTNSDDSEFAALMDTLSGDVSCYDYSLKILDPQGTTTMPLPLQTEPTIENNNVCPHGLVSGNCWFCKEEMGAAFQGMCENMSFPVNEVARSREQDLMDLLGRRKLYLVLDLDHTLLNSVRLNHLIGDEWYLCSQGDSLPESLRSNLYRLDWMNLLTKLRPFVHSFLREASVLFEMYICTRADRCYAMDMAKLIDPGNVYFNNYSRVTGREDCPSGKRKSLDAFSGQENAVVILDDTEDVWENDRANLILAERYHYFVESMKRDKKCANLRSYSVLKTDESEDSGGLVTALNVLRRVHAEFFNLVDQSNDPLNQDVRQVVNAMVG